jgi:hypothetical protein
MVMSRHHNSRLLRAEAVLRDANRKLAAGDRIRKFKQYPP